MKIVQIPKPPETVVTFADLKEGEKFYLVVDFNKATLWHKIRRLGTGEFFALYMDGTGKEAGFTTLAPSDKVCRVCEEKAPPVDKLYFKDLKPGETFFFKGGNQPFLKTDDYAGWNIVNPKSGGTFPSSGDSEVIRVHSEFHHATP